MPRKALRCNVELDVHSVTCPGVYLPYRNDVYLSITLFRGQYRRTILTSPIFPLVFHEKFRFDKLFYTAYQPQQVADHLQDDHVRIELVQLSDVRECGRLLAYYECNARDFLYPYPQYGVSAYGTGDRQILMERTFEFPGIAPKLEFSTKTTLTEVDQPLTASGMYDSALLSDSSYSIRPRSSRSPFRRRSLSRGRSSSPKFRGYHHRRPTIASISRYRSTSPCLHQLKNSLRDLTISTQHDDEEKPPFVVRKVDDSLINRTPGIKDTRYYRRCRHSKSRSPSRRKHSGRYYDSDDYGRTHTHSRKVVREPYTDYSSYSDDDVLSDVSDPGPSYLARSGSLRRSLRTRSPSPVLGRRSLRERYEDDTLNALIETKVDAAIRRNRSIERLDRPSSRGSTHEDDFRKIREYERDLAIARNRSLVHIDDGEYWTQKAAEYKGKSHRDVFNENLQKVYNNMHKEGKKTRFDDRIY